LRRTLSVCPSVCLSVRPVLVYIRTVLRAHIQNRKTSVFGYGPASRMYFSARAEGRISYGHLGGRTNLLLLLLLSPLSALVSSLSLNHHLYADDTQLSLSFRPPDFDSSVTHLQNDLQHLSSWMTANLLTLNSSKTEFLLIGLQQQLIKIHNCSLNTTDSARNLSFIFDSHLQYHCHI